MTLSHLKVQVTAAEPEVPSARLTSCANHEHALTRRQQALEFDQHLTSICDLVIAIFFFLFFEALLSIGFTSCLLSALVSNDS